MGLFIVRVLIIVRDSIMDWFVMKDGSIMRVVLWEGLRGVVQANVGQKLLKLNILRVFTMSKLINI